MLAILTQEIYINKDKVSMINKIIKLANIFEIKIKLAQDIFDDIEKSMSDIIKQKPNQTKPLSERIKELNFEHFDGTDAEMFDISFDLLPQNVALYIEQYIGETYPVSKENGNLDEYKILHDPKVTSILNPFINVIKKQWEVWKQTHVDGDRESQQDDAKKQEDKRFQTERNKTRRPFTDLDISALNVRTLDGIDIEKTIKSLNNGEGKGNVQIEVIIEPDKKTDYYFMISNNTLSESLKYKITSGLHKFDNAILKQINYKEINENKYINTPIKTIF